MLKTIVFLSLIAAIGALVLPCEKPTKDKFEMEEDMSDVYPPIGSNVMFKNENLVLKNRKNIVDWFYEQDTKFEKYIHNWQKAFTHRFDNFVEKYRKPFERFRQRWRDTKKDLRKVLFD